MGTICNLNDRVKFKVRPKGQKMWNKHWKKYYDITPPQAVPDELQLWDFMNIFGPGMGVGLDPPVETTIEIISSVSNAKDPYNEKPHRTPRTPFPL